MKIQNTNNVKQLNSRNILSTLIAKRPSNAFLLFTTGFFFSLFILLNILYSKDPFGGWVTSIGTFTTPSILLTVLLVLSVCLFTLWKSAVNSESSTNSKTSQANIVKTQTNFSPIDYPKGSTHAVVSGYSLG